MMQKIILGGAVFTGLQCCTGTPQQVGPIQIVRVVDEGGRPVDNARVRLFLNESTTVVLRTATTDHDGVARFERLAQGRYVIDAASPPRWNLEANEVEGRSAWFGGEVVTVAVHELRLVGVRLPGGRFIGGSQGTWNHHHPASQEVLRESPRWPADAHVLHGFRSPRAPHDATHMEFITEWFGYAPHVERQAWTPASRFAGPRIVDRAELEAVPWRELPVLLRDPDGTPLPPETMRAVRRQCVLMRRDDSKYHRFYRLDPVADRQDRVAVSCGDYQLRLDQTGPWREVPLTISEDTTSIDCKLPVQLRLLRLRLDGVVGSNWAVRAEGAGYFSSLSLPTSANVVEMPLFLGESVLEFGNHLEGGGYQRRVLRVVIRDEDVHEVRWDVR